MIQKFRDSKKGLNCFKAEYIVPILIGMSTNWVVIPMRRFYELICNLKLKTILASLQLSFFEAKG